VGEEAVGDIDASRAQKLDGEVEIGGVPVDDAAVTRSSPTPESFGSRKSGRGIALPMEKEGAAQRIAGLAFVESRMAELTKSGSKAT